MEPRPSREELQKLSKDELIDIIYSLYDIIEKHSKQIAELQAIISNKKNSKNSSKPPSTDLTYPSRKKNKKGKYGPSKGHKGISRKISEKPDFIMNIPVEKCPRTGQTIKSHSKSYKIHQILELTTPKFNVIEIRRQITTGPDGKTVIAPNPAGVKDYQRFGNNFKMYVCYLRYRLNVPWKRIISFLEEIAKDKISVGALQNIFEELKTELTDESEEIKEKIRKSESVGIDETSIKVNGDRHWLSVFRTQKETYFGFSPNRSHALPQEILGTDYKGIIISDFYGVYTDKYFPKAKEFQKCLAHVLRDIQYALELKNGNSDYAKKLMDVVLDAVYLKKYFTFATPDYLEQRQEIESRLNELVFNVKTELPKEANRLRKRFKKCRTDVFTFLYHENIPFDNNGSERDIRELVICRKISGAYKTTQGLGRLTVIKSVISTALKNHNNVSKIFKNAFNPVVLEYG